MSSSSIEVIAVKDPGDFVVQDVKAKVGNFMLKGAILFTLKAKSSGQVSKIKADKSGKPVKILHKSGAEVKHGDPILEFLAGECDHPTVMKNMCAECGADLEQDMSMVPSLKASNAPASIAIVHSIPELKVSSNEAQNLGREDEQRLLKQRRLVLLVDLDQTLIHTTNENVPPNMRDVLHFQLYGPKSPWYHTRIRPGTADFLKRISSLYELHIVTFGARLYAHTIAKFLDPDSKYFSHRILSRDECFDSRSKTANLSSLFPCGDHMVCIIDDREDVWNYAPNLVHVKPYIFFKNTGDINAPPGSSRTSKTTEAANEDLGPERRIERRQSIDMPTIDEDNAPVTVIKDDNNESNKKNDDDISMVSDDLELSDEESNLEPAVRTKDADKKEKEGEESSEKKADQQDDESKSEEDDLIEMEDHDDYLLYLEDILKSIHKAYYDLFDQMKSSNREQEAGEILDKSPDLKTVIPYVKRKVLQGVSIVFSGVVPTHISLEKSKAYMVAKTLGAKVHDRISKETTHVVAARTGTAKVNDARKRKSIQLVTPDWLWCCAERWEKADERLYPLYKSAPVTLKPPAHCSSPEIAFAERCPTRVQHQNSQSLPESMNPFLAFSHEDLKGMDKEVEDILSGESSSSDDEDEGEEKKAESSSEESMTGELPKGQKRKKPVNDDDEDDGPADRFRRGEDVPSDYEIASQSDDDEDSRIQSSQPKGEDDDDDDDDEEEDDELGAQLEREFLDQCNSNSSFANDDQ